MRVRRLARVAGHGTASRAGSVRHALRRRREPGGWTRHDPHRILWVAPDDVSATTAVRLDEALRGRVVDGDWDLAALPLHDLAVWRGLHQRLVEGRPWEDTDLAPGRSVPEAPNVGGRPQERDPRLVAQRWERLDSLARSLRTEGWLPHHDVGAGFSREMAVVVGRDGRLIRNSGGLHRLVIARIIGLERIPCRVLAEHPATPADADG